MAVNMNWLDDFVRYAGICEASPRMMYWVGVSTLAGALRRKVWIDEEVFKWTPNFYIMLVGPPGVVKKSTSINIGYSMLAQIPGINFGPDSVTWQALVTDMSLHHETWTIDGEDLTTTCASIGLDEFGSFYDPTDRAMTDALTHLWDTKSRPFRKSTKGGGDEVLENPYLNMIGCTTPAWLADNLGESAAGGGLASRFIYLYEDGSAIRDIAYPSRHLAGKRQAFKQLRADLVAQLYDISQLIGRYKLTDAAYELGEAWYGELRATLRDRGFESLEAWFLCRQQTMAHKLAMVISAATGRFPIIDRAELLAARTALELVNTDMARIFGYVGQTPLGRTTQELLERITRDGPIEKRALWRAFFRKLRPHEFEEALQGVLATGFVVASGPLANPSFELASTPKRKSK